MKKILCIICGAIFIFSCKKSSPQTQNPPPVPQDTCKPSPAVIKGTYKITAIKYRESNTAPEQDWYSSLQDCEKDNTYQLNADSSVLVSEGADVCPGPPPPGGISNWYLLNNNTQVALDAIYDIDSFDCTTLVVTEKDSRVPGDTRTVTYVKQ